MEVAVEKRATTPLQQHRLRPLINAVADRVKLRGGMVRLDELTKEVLCKGENGDQLIFATELLAFFSTLQICKDAGLKFQKDGIGSHGDYRSLIHRLAKVIEEVASAASDERHADELWSIDRERLKNALQESSVTQCGTSQLGNISDVLLEAVLKQCRKQVEAHKVRAYSMILWWLRFSNITQILDTVLQQIGKPAHFTEVV